MLRGSELPARRSVGALTSSRLHQHVPFLLSFMGRRSNR